MERLEIPRLWALTDETLQSRFRHDELAVAAWRGGADAVQLRDKIGDAVRRRATARRLAALRREFEHARLFLNDDPELAAAVEADGVHVGPEDPPPSVARAWVGRERLVGYSAGSVEEAEWAEREGVDYLGVGPVYGSRSKSDAGLPLGLPGLARIVQATRLPVIAIGSVTVERIEEILEQGAHGVALLSAYCLADDPGAIVERAAETLRRALERRGRSW